MSYRCDNPEKYENKVVDNGECVRFVQVAANVPHTTTWIQGEQVKGSAYIPKGTAIATFADGKYPTDSHGKHAAIYISHDDDGIWVWEQWVDHPVAKRKIYYREGDHYRSNDGDYFYVIE